MDMRSVRHQIEGREWQQRILEQQTSGLSIRKWCTEQNLRESQFYYWLRILRGEELALQKPAGIFAELPSQSPIAGKCNHGAAGICAVIRDQNGSLRNHRNPVDHFGQDPDYRRYWRRFQVLHDSTNKEIFNFNLI